MAMVLSNVEDERCFFNMSFMKRKLKNQLTTHLDLMWCKCIHKAFTLWSLSHLLHLLDLGTNKRIERL
jgi:hypothetical protein